MFNLERVKLHAPGVPECAEILRTIISKRLTILHLNIEGGNPHNHPWSELDGQLKLFHEGMDNRLLNFRVDSVSQRLPRVQDLLPVFTQREAVVVDSELFPAFVGSWSVRG